MSQAGSLPETSAFNSLIIHVQTFDASGTYTPSGNMVYCIIECVGGGGGSGGCNASGALNTSAAGSGGGGGYARLVASAATIGASQSVTVGAGGTAGSAGNNNGGTGGTSSVGSLVSATGGGGGQGGSTTSTSYVRTGGAGGVGTGGDINTTGAPGGLGVAVASLSATIISSLGGGSSYFGGGAIAQGLSDFSNQLAGIPGQSWGGGACGSVAGYDTGTIAGAAGYQGVVIITEYVAG
jgi:hypothetical protein